MTQATFTEFRKHARAYFDSVEKGSTVQILRHGKVIAKIIPSNEPSGEKAWKKPGLRLVIPGASLTKAVLEDRRKARY